MKKWTIDYAYACGEHQAGENCAWEYYVAYERARTLADAARANDGDARLGRILMRYIDRMTDPDDACDPLGKIVQELAREVDDEITLQRKREEAE